LQSVKKSGMNDILGVDIDIIDSLEDKK